MIAHARPKGALAAARARPAAALAVLWLAVVVIAGFLAPLSAYDVVMDVDPTRSQAPPGTAHWLGTDHLGRDVFMRLVFACQFFVGPGLLACAVATALAVPAGAVAGFRGGGIESLLRWGFTVIASVPRFVLVLLVLSIYGDRLGLLAVAAGVAYAPTLAEAVFARIEALRNAEYVLANRAYGVPDWRILWVHLVWAACRRLIGRHLLLLFGYFLVLETTLSYIGGFGVQEPMPSWGNMLVFEWGRGHWYGASVLAPVIALWVTITATAWAADAISEVDDG